METFCGLKGIKKLSEMGVKSRFVTQYYNYEEPVEYSLKAVPVGYTNEKETLCLDFRKSGHVVIVAKTRSGKTVLTQNLLSRIMRCEEPKYAITPTDLKDEYSYCDRPLQQKFHRFVFPHEREYSRFINKGIPTKSYMPVPLSNIANRKFPRSKLFQYNVSDMSYDDFITIGSADDITPNQRMALQTAFTEISEGKIYDINTMRVQIKKNTQINDKSKPFLYLLLDRLEKDGVIGNQYEKPTFIQDMLNGIMPVLNLCEATSGGDKGMAARYATAYLAIALRSIYSAKKSGVLKHRCPLFVNIDEARLFVPSLGNPSSKSAILDLLRIGGEARVSMWLNYQYMRDVPDVVISQARYVILPWNLDLDIMAEALRRFVPTIYETPQTFKADISRDYYQEMKKRDWLLIDRHKTDKNITIFRPKMPLCYHHEE